MMRLVMMGPPGAGKGTQSARLSRLLSVPAISTGELLRAHVRDRTALGLEVETTLASGEYVGDDVVTAMVAARLDDLDARRGFVLDGYPRTDTQAAELLDIMRARSTVIDAVLVLDLDELTAGRRLLARGEGRADDSAEVISRRRALHDRQAAPVIDHLGRRCPVLHIDSAAPVEDVADRMDRALRGLQVGRA